MSPQTPYTKQHVVFLSSYTVGTLEISYLPPDPDPQLRFRGRSPLVMSTPLWNRVRNPKNIEREFSSLQTTGTSSLLRTWTLFSGNQGVPRSTTSCLGTVWSSIIPESTFLPPPSLSSSVVLPFTTTSLTELSSPLFTRLRPTGFLEDLRPLDYKSKFIERKNVVFEEEFRSHFRRRVCSRNSLTDKDPLVLFTESRSRRRHTLFCSYYIYPLPLFFFIVLVLRFLSLFWYCLFGRSLHVLGHSTQTEKS